MTIFSSKIAGAASLVLLVALAFTGCSSEVSNSNPTEQKTETPSRSATAKPIETLQSYYTKCGIKAGAKWVTTQANKIENAGKETAIDKRRDAKCPGALVLSLLSNNRPADTASQIPQSVTWDINEKELPSAPDANNEIHIKANINIIYNEGTNIAINGTTVIVIDKRDNGYNLTYKDTMSKSNEQSTTDALTDAIQNTSTKDTSDLW